MYDGGKIIVGLIIFLVLVTLPIWFTRAYGDASHRPDPQRPTDEKECVEPVEFMKAWHMDLLDEWRDAVVRDGDRLYKATDGELHQMSLTHNCMKCHTDHEKFCNSCHKFAGVEPYCWDCHIQPEGK
jgi:cytochrome c